MINLFFVLRYFMTRQLLAAVGLALACAIPVTPAFAYVSYINGNELYGWCSTKEQATVNTAQSLCAAYVLGVVDEFEMTRAGLGKTTCLREGIITQQLIDVVTASLRDHPETRDKPASGLVQTAITHALCPELNQ